MAKIWAIFTANGSYLCSRGSELRNRHVAKNQGHNYEKYILWGINIHNDF